MEFIKHQINNVLWVQSCSRFSLQSKWIILLSREEPTSLDNSQASREMGHRQNPYGDPVGGFHVTCMCDTWRNVRGCSILWKTAAWKMKTKGRKFEKPRRKGRGKKKKNEEAASVFTLVGPLLTLYSSLHSTGLRFPLALTPVYLLPIFWLLQTLNLVGGLGYF